MKQWLINKVKNDKNKVDILKVGKLGAWIIVLSVSLYAAILLVSSYFFENFKIATSGTFGDSFGLITCIFSGLSSVGMIVAVLMQREELELQRNELRDNGIILKQQQLELEKSADAQKIDATLSALSILHQEYKRRIELNEVALSKISNLPAQQQSFLVQNAYYLENDVLVKRSDSILKEIEEIVVKYGVNLPPFKNQINDENQNT